MFRGVPGVVKIGRRCRVGFTRRRVVCLLVAADAAGRLGIARPRVGGFTVCVPQQSASPVGLCRPPLPGAGLNDPPSANLGLPGSTRVSCLLMQDAVAANVVSVAGAQAGSLAGKVNRIYDLYEIRCTKAREAAR